MTAVSNTTPLNYLVLIAAVEVLPQIYQRVLVPQGVVSDLRHARTPEPVRSRIDRIPSWLEVISVTVPADASLDHLDLGEREAIVLAEQVGADVLLIDERIARREAARRGLRTTGTLGVLDRSADHQLLDLPSAIARLKRTPFRVSDALLATFLERDALRTRHGTELP